MTDTATETAAAPQLSPDRQWWWNGHKWEPAGHTQLRPAPGGPPGSAAFHAWVGGAQPRQEPRQRRPAAPAPGGWTGPGWNGPGWNSPAGTPYLMPPLAPAGADGMAIGSLISAFVPVVGSIAAVVLGHLSRGRAKQERREPSGVAMAGLILGYIGIAFLIVGILAALAIPTFLAQRSKGWLAADLTATAAQEDAYHRATGTYADVETLRLQGRLHLHANVQVALLSVSPTSYCLGAQVASTTRYYTPESGVRSASCVGGNGATG